MCEYPQFAGRAQEVTDGWYYSEVLLTPPGGGSQYGAVRDLYVRLSDQAPAPGTGNTTGGGNSAQPQPPTASDEAGDATRRRPRLNRAATMDYSSAVEMEASTQTLLMRSEDLREFRTAFRRAP